MSEKFEITVHFKENSFWMSRNTFVKGTVSREKLFTWGLGEMDWTLTIDRTWFLHFPDQLFKCHNILTVCRLEVKPVDDFQQLMRSAD